MTWVQIENMMTQLRLCKLTVLQVHWLLILILPKYQMNLDAMDLFAASPLASYIDFAKIPNESRCYGPILSRI